MASPWRARDRAHIRDRTSTRSISGAHAGYEGEGISCFVTDAAAAFKTQSCGGFGR